MIALAIHKKRGSVHGNAGFSAARAADNGQKLYVFIADGAVLLRLDGGNDVSDVAAGCAGKNVQQQSVVNTDIRVHKIDELAVFHFILAL